MAPSGRRLGDRSDGERGEFAEWHCVNLRLYARRGFANIGVTPSKDPTRCDPNFLSENTEDAEQVILCACDFVTNSRGDIYDDVEDVMAKNNVFAQGGTARTKATG
jgi:hypothetical protein